MKKTVLFCMILGWMLFLPACGSGAETIASSAAVASSAQGEYNALYEGLWCAVDAEALDDTLSDLDIRAILDAESQMRVEFTDYGMGTLYEGEYSAGSIAYIAYQSSIEVYLLEETSPPLVLELRDGQLVADTESVRIYFEKQ